MHALLQRAWEAFETETFKKGEVVVRQGEEGGKLYVIVAGECAVHKAKHGDTGGAGAAPGLPLP